MNIKQDKNISQQLSLFDETEIDLNDSNLFDDDFDLNFESSDRTIEIDSELLTLKLLRKAITAEHPEDLVMAYFAEYVLPNLLKFAIGVTAKGGKFFDRIDSERQAANKSRVRRDNAGDQSLNTHLLNGLFPAYLISRILEQADTTVKREFKKFRDIKQRILVSSFILHDFEKFDYNLFACIPNKYKDNNLDIRKLSIEEHREILSIIVTELSLDKFLTADLEEDEQWQDYLDDLLFIAYNTQVRYDTNLNLSEYGLNPKLKDRTLICLADLCCLADSLASIIKHPQDAEHDRLKGLIHNLSDGQLKFTYHRLAENRGVLTNVVNNALIQAHTDLNTEDNNYYQPLLYLPTGVIYLAAKDAPSISIADIPNRVISSIKQLCADRLMQSQTGFGRDGKGMKYADYYEQFFNIVGLMQVALRATLRILNDKKSSVAKSRSNNLVKFQQQGVLPTDYDFTFEDDIRCDRLAEFGDVVSRKIWGEKVNQIEAVIKALTDKEAEKLPDIDLIIEIAEYWNLKQYIPQIREIQNINQSLKELKLKGNTGGVPYEWYYLAAKYLQHNPGIEDVRETGEKLIEFIAGLIQPIVDKYELPDGWDDLRLWVNRIVMLPLPQPLSYKERGERQGEGSHTTAQVFLDELNNYQLAKKPGRGRQLICSISHSAYTVTEQMESAVLFTPQVYTNKQMLGGSNAKRNISSIAGVEMMLRQILMNNTQAVGKRFEDGKYRYLYFYPTYYFTPETNKFLTYAYANIAQTRFSSGVRNHFINNELQANFSKQRYQSVDAFLIDEDLQVKQNLPEDDPNYKKDYSFKLSYPDDLPLTFYFMALPPGRDSTDTESWVMPAWLAFAFPMILDVKTVVSESPIPPFTDGTEFEETVFLDSAPQAFKVLTKRDRFRLDYILEGWEEGDKNYPAPLNVLTAAYAIHLDVNAKQGKSGYNSNWGKLTELAKDLETSPLYVFNYLNQWVRRQNVDTARIEKIKLYAYHFYPCFDPYAQYNFTKQEWNMEKLAKSPLNHPLQLTELYRKFYRANKLYNPKANAVLKPIEIAADTILKAESTVFHGETLVHAVAAEVTKLMDRVHASTADGRWVFTNQERDKERQAILEFSRYFVEEVFEKSFAGDRARLAGKQINLIRDTCEFLYRLENDKDIEEKKKNNPDDSEE
ncbi:CRISPR-associated protein Csc3 (plasmid) [Stanieria cyanosphaera PCC 7437]|uniref:CRISPR-associated protein Csc3 n=1 Tax=Stanieria cyanosphaera (strain ATCC 29371 / PCC 7437) TaxID=111780 RepID=K9XZG9_STAC7|nr:type I-D CRISPR-associated protein Cas10d/Csc3 [Stanieria cyanosphaera]AFZ37990.1 CRISPR-associated protein Csc3 [Stanieria cyanosphaera PCC 7437]